jgi:hypothetical protein
VGSSSVSSTGTYAASANSHQPRDTTALARAWRWQRLVDRRVFGSVTEIAQAERISKSYVSRILRLALLAPDIVEAILGGWADQRRLVVRAVAGQWNGIAVRGGGVFENGPGLTGAEDLVLGQGQQQRFADGKRSEPGRCLPSMGSSFRE